MDRKEYLRVRADNALKELAEYNEGISALLTVALDYLFSLEDLNVMEEHIAEVENLVIEYISNIIESNEECNDFVIRLN